MPTPGRPQTPLAEHPTRQQLDDLDALMQRMLALPVNPQDDGSAPPPAPPVAPVGAATPPKPPPAVPENKPRPDTKKEGVAFVPVGASAVEGQEARTPVVLVALPVKAGSAEKASAAVRERGPAWTAPPAALWLRPLLWINRVYDGLTAWLGPPGRWLRGRQGRTLLGGVGVLLLLAAVAWVTLHRMGWTWQGLPVQ